jgi:hypothetical protein
MNEQTELNSNEGASAPLMHSTSNVLSALKVDKQNKIVTRAEHQLRAMQLNQRQLLTESVTVA